MLKFYLDTSVYGGYFDEEFSEWTKPFFEQVRAGKFQIILSDVTLGELEKAPDSVWELPSAIPDQYLDLVSITPEQLELADNYVEQGELLSKFHSDAQHIAISTILKADSLVSWNFKHMVNFFRIK